MRADLKRHRVSTNSRQAVSRSPWKVQQLVSELQTKLGPFAMDCFAESIRLNRLLIPLLVAARGELDLRSARKSTQVFLDETYAHLDKHIDGFIEDVAAATKEQQARQ